MNFNCPELLAGFSQIEFLLVSETSNWPLVVTDNNAGQITITREDVDVNGTIEPESISVNDKPKEGEDGKTWPIDISFTYMYRGEPMEQLLEQYAALPGVAIACLNDGTRKLFGTNQEPIYLSWENIYGERIEDRHGVAIRIKGTMSQRPCFYKPE